MSKYCLYPLCFMLTILSGCAQTIDNADASLNVMSFNIRYNNPDDGIYAWPNRRSLVVSTIKFHGADLIGMQEVLKSQIDDLEEAMPNYDWIGVGRNDGKEAGEFAPIFYDRERFDLLDYGTFWLSESPDQIGSRGWDAALPRIATWAKFKDKVSDVEFLHLNTHFDHRGEQARIESAKLIANALPVIGSDLPWVVTGDFNKAPGSDVYKTMTESLIDAKPIARISAHGPEGTFGGFTVEVDETSERIDYIFLGQSITVERYGALSDQWNGYYPSDHLPVMAEIVFP